MIPKDNVFQTQFSPDGVPHLTLAQIEDEIRTLRAAERIELYKWLDHVVVADCGADTSFGSRLGVDRSLEIRLAIVSKSCGIPITKALASRESLAANRTN